MPLTAADLKARHTQSVAPVQEPVDTSEWSTEPTAHQATSNKGQGWKASPFSLRYLNDLLRTRQHDLDIPETLNQTQVSRLIDTLKVLPVKVGLGGPRKPELAPTPSQPVLISATVPLAEATHTIIFEDDSYQTIKIERQPVGDRFMPGKLIIRYLSGPDNTSDYTGYGDVSEDGKVVKIWRKHTGNSKLVEATKVLVGDPKAAALAYARRSEQCYRCHAPLTQPESLERGCGPVCAEKGY